MVKDIFSGVLHDNLSGSGQILFRVQQELLAFCRADESYEISPFLKQLERLEQHFPHFALLYHFVNKLKLFVEENHPLKGHKLAAFVSQYQRNWKYSQQKASENFLKNLSPSGKNILVHSNSSAIQNLFGVMADRKIFPAVWQTVSSPADEGIIQAEFLKNHGFDVHVFHEDAVSKFMVNIDFAVFGADLLWDNAFLNKTGTLPLALIFRHFHKPVYVLAENRKKIDTTKITPKRLQRFLREQPKPVEEIMKKDVVGVHAHNYYFETVPLSLVKQVFTEE